MVVANPLPAPAGDVFYQLVLNTPLVQQAVVNSLAAGGGIDGAMRTAQSAVHNMLSSRADLVRTLLDPRRDVYDSCGLPRSELTAEQYQFLFDRESTAARVVECLAKEAWQVQPEVFELQDGKTQTEFENSWDAMGDQLRGEQNWYMEEKGSPVWSHLLNADVLSGIGRYGVIVLGLDDGMELREPAVVAPGPKAKRQLLYMTELPEALAPVGEWDTNRNSPRYQQPLYYNCRFNYSEGGVTGTGNTSGRDERVHWSRVLHIADISHQASANRFFAVPRMRPVLNHILALQKLYPGSAEMYWLGAFPGISIESPQGAVKPNDIAKIIEQFKPMITDYINDLQRFIMLFGLSAKSMAPQVVDPTAQINVHTEAICIKLGIPIRKFKGSERGQLASSQDDGDWNDLLRERHWNYMTPQLVVPLANRGIALNFLAQPRKGFSTFWPDLESQTDAEKATVAATKTNAINVYAAGNASALIVPFDFWTLIMGEDDETAQSIVDNADKQAEEEQKQALLDQQAAQAAMAQDAAAQGTIPPDQLPPGQAPPVPAPVGNEEDEIDEVATLYHLTNEEKEELRAQWQNQDTESAGFVDLEPTANGVAH